MPLRDGPVTGVRRRLWVFLRSVMFVVCVLVLFVGLAHAVEPKPTAKPWFLVGKEAAQQRLAPSTKGFFLELSLLPEVRFATVLMMPYVSAEFGSKHLTLLGHVDVGWGRQWLSPGEYLFGVVPVLSFNIRDGGSALKFKYRWKTAEPSSLFHRELQVVWYPFSSAPFQMGEVLEALWFLHPPRRTEAGFAGLFGLSFSWDRFQLESLVSISILQTRIEDLTWAGRPAPSFLNRIRIRLHRQVSIGMDGGFMQGGSFSRNPVKGKPYWAWGVHPVLRGFVGKEPTPLAFLSRRRRDPRAQGRGLPSFRNHRGLSLTTELGIQGHHLQDPDTFAQLKWEMAYAFTTRIRGQWDMLMGELLFHWHNLSWTVAGAPGFVPFQALAKDAGTEGLWLLAAAIGLRPHRIATVAMRVEVSRGSLYLGGIPPEITGNPSSKNSGESVLLRAVDDVSILPPNTEAIPETTILFNVRLEPWSFVSLMLECWFHIDPNFVRSVNGGNQRVVENRYLFGTELLLQVRFR